MSYVGANNLDDLMRKVFELLLDGKKRVVATKGASYEEFGVTLGLRNPRFRLSRAETRQILVSCLGELLWYLSGNDDLAFIQHYLKRYDESAEPNGKIHGAYGPRLFNSQGINQVEAVISLLKRKSSSRRAAIQIFEARDLLSDYKDIPCTCTLQFMVRNSRLNMIVFMRSNDAYRGLPHDIFAFTMLQEIMARSLGVELGTYKHSVGSLHLYDYDAKKAQRYLDEGFQDARPMPRMPEGDPWPAIRKVQKLEEQIRLGKAAPFLPGELPEFWADLVRILKIYSLGENGAEKREIVTLKKAMSTDVYDSYARKFERKATIKPTQQELPLESNDER